MKFEKFISIPISYSKNILFFLLFKNDSSYHAWVHGDGWIRTAKSAFFVTLGFARFGGESASGPAACTDYCTCQKLRFFAIKWDRKFIKRDSKVWNVGNGIGGMGVDSHNGQPRAGCRKHIIFPETSNGVSLILKIISLGAFVSPIVFLAHVQ